MANVVNIQKVSGQWHLFNDDGTMIPTYSGPNGVHFVAGGGNNPPPAPGRFMWPFDPRPQNQGGTMSSEYGPRSPRFHQGIDIAAGMNKAPIPAAGAGRVTLAHYNGNFGNCVIIDHGDRLYTLYAHQFEQPHVSQGATVNKGQIIGIVGNTGASFGAHLHFETHVGGTTWSNPGTHINPRTFMERYAG